MRAHILLIVLLMAGCSRYYPIKVCGGHWWTCSYYRSEEDLKSAEARELVEAKEYAKTLDIDYEKCAAAILLPQIAEPASEMVSFVSVMGEDPSPKLEKILRDLGAKFEAGSKFEPDGKKNWLISIGLVRKKWFGGYLVYTGYYCGPLCAGGTELTLEKSGDSCKIVSTRNLGNA